jgi:hypothetical protein
MMMNLKAGHMYDAIHKKEDKSIMFEVVECGRRYIQVHIHEINGEVLKNEFLDMRLWSFYEIRNKEHQQYQNDLIEIQRLAVNLGCKDLFDKCKKDLEGGLTCHS